MKRQSRIFFVAFTATGTVVAPLVYLGRPLWGFAAGAVGVLVHWALSRNGADDGELADSSYFFGFLLTLVFLAVGLYKLGAPPSAQPGLNGTTDSTRVVLGFLEDLAAGLALTIVGLLVRQVRTLGAAGAPAAAREEALHAAQLELTRNLEALIEMWRQRPEQQVLQELHESRSIARSAAEDLQQSVVAAGERMLGSVARLDDATAAAAQAMTRTASGLGESLAQTMQRIEAEVGQALGSIERQRVETAEALAVAQAAATSIRNDANTHMQEHLELWRTTLEQARTALDEAHRSLDREYRRGLEGFASSGTAFAELAASAAERVAALPDPSERLVGLWDGVRRLESGLTTAIAGSVAELATLRDRSEQLSVALARLGDSADAAADSLGAGGDRLAETLQRELRQMNGVIDEYVSLLESTTASLTVRA